jgi:hypothetical protein
MAQKLQLMFMQLPNNNAASYLPSQYFSPVGPRADESGIRGSVRRCSALVREGILPRTLALFCALDSPRVAATIDRIQQKLMR